MRQYGYMKKNTLIIGIVLAVVVALGVALYLNRDEYTPAPVFENKEEEPTAKAYSSADHGISFEYSPSYYLKERDTGTVERPQHSVVLVEDTQENRDVIDGRNTEGRDGPIAITIDIYENPDELSADDWVRAETNWTVRTSDAAPIGRGQITGVTYTWDGLYQGKSVVVAEGAKAYVFSVTSLTSEDAILAEFDRLLESVRLLLAA